MTSTEQQVREIAEKAYMGGIAFERGDTVTGNHLFHNVDQATAALLSLIEQREVQARVDELGVHRGNALGGGKAGIVLSHEEVEARLETLKEKSDITPETLKVADDWLIKGKYSKENL